MKFAETDESLISSFRHLDGLWLIYIEIDCQIYQSHNFNIRNSRSSSRNREIEMKVLVEILIFSKEEVTLSRVIFERASSKLAFYLSIFLDL